MPFQNLRVNSQFYILHKDGTPYVEVGAIAGVSNPVPDGTQPVMFGQPMKMVVDITVKVGEQTVTFVTRNFAASLFRNIKYFTLRKLYLCRKWMQKRLQKTTTTGITLPNFDFLA